MSDSPSEGGGTEMTTTTPAVSTTTPPQSPPPMSGPQLPDSVFDDFDHAGPHEGLPSAHVPPVRRRTSGHFVGSAGIDFGVTRDNVVLAARRAGASRKEAELPADLDQL